MTTEPVPLAPIHGFGATPQQVSLLGVATPPSEVKTRPGGGSTLSYIDARFVMDRFDTAVGPHNWQREHYVDQNGNVCCKVGVLVRFEEKSAPVWVWKSDVGTESSIEEVKGQYSDSFKRAAVSWGVARDLYDEKSEARTAASRPVTPPSPAAVAGAERLAHLPEPDPGWTCPIHGTRRVVPAGVSAKTGQPYPAFVTCEVRDCRERPPRGGTTVRPAANRTPRIASAPAYENPVSEFVGVGDEV